MVRLEDYDDHCCVLMSPSDVRDVHNQTPLHYSCGGGFPFRVNLDTVRYLVERAHCDVSELLQYKFFNLNSLMYSSKQSNYSTTTTTPVQM